MCRTVPVQPVSRAGGSTTNKAKKKCKTVTFISQNVRGIKSNDRIEELCAFFNKHKIFAACIQETLGTGNELLQNGNILITGAGLNREQIFKRGSQGVGFVLSPAATDAWRTAGSETYNSYGARVMAIRLLVKDTQQRDIHLLLISAYAPISNADQTIWDEYLADLSSCISQKSTRDILIIATDTNASMGYSTESNCLGNFGIPHVTNQGYVLVLTYQSTT